MFNREKELENVKRLRKPSWLKSSLPTHKNYSVLKNELKERKIATVCTEASCPNIGECWDQKTATMMILGDVCTRACKFCNVKTGNPNGFINTDEIKQAVEMVRIMNLKYLVVTSVDRDDLKDFGASHFANVVNAINDEFPDTKVEVLIPDFDVNEVHMKTLANSNPFVIAQNLETVKRLTHPVRDRRAGYAKTLKALNFYKNNNSNVYTKSSLMVGLGESEEELIESMKDLRDSNVDILTIGQYMRPSLRHLPVLKYYHPNEFSRLKKIGLDLGFKFVASGPLIRSSYKAADFLDFLNNEKKSE